MQHIFIFLLHLYIITKVSGLINKKTLIFKTSKGDVKLSEETWLNLLVHRKSADILAETNQKITRNGGEDMVMKLSNLGGYCYRDQQCFVTHSVCVSQRCQCPSGTKADYLGITCENNSTTTQWSGDWDSYCTRDRDCEWINSICSLSNKCACPNFLKPNFDLKRCESYYYNTPTKSNDKNILIGIAGAAFTFILILSMCVYISSKARRHNRQRRRNSIEFTSSTLQLLGELNDHPPEYSDVYMVRPQPRINETTFKLPTYEEAINNQTGWNSEELHAPDEIDNTLATTSQTADENEMSNQSTVGEEPLLSVESV